MSDDPELTIVLAAARAGDPAARNALFARTQARLEGLARRMLRRHPAVGRWADAADLVQNASVRLLRALETAPAADTRGFFNLAAAVMRRELLDLARHFHGPLGVGANHGSVAGADAPVPDTAAPDPGAAELDRWTALHAAVETLPVAEREVFGLTVYHGWSQAQIAELFQVDERTVRRRWKAACAALGGRLGGDPPAGG